MNSPSNSTSSPTIGQSQTTTRNGNNAPPQSTPAPTFVPTPCTGFGCDRPTRPKYDLESKLQQSEADNQMLMRDLADIDECCRHCCRTGTNA